MVNPRTRLKARKQFTLSVNSHKISLGRYTKIMGIINMTPDSFSRDGCIGPKKNALAYGLSKARRFIKEGADILDIGGESTRPGARPISDQEEAARVIPFIKKLKKNVAIPLSVDTYKTEVAHRALDAGADVINNINGIHINKKLVTLIKKYGAGIVLMHIKGTPRTMQKNVHYDNLLREIYQSLKHSIEKCLEWGINSDKIIIDPGIGFGKTVEHNLTILNRLDYFKKLKFPLMVGTSRKSFVGKILNEDVDNRLWGSLATVCAAIYNGAHIVRVHDVQETKHVVNICDSVLNESVN